MLGSLLLGCTPDPGTVEMSGEVHDLPDANGDLVEGVRLSVLDGDLVEVGDTVSGADGSFTVATPAGHGFYLELAGEGFLPTHFSGTAGLSDFTAGSGYPWIADQAWLDSVKAVFTACPTVDEPGGVVAGDVRLFVNGVSNYQSLPTVDTARVTVFTQTDTEAYGACYHDDDGISVSDAFDSGADGQFAVFGVPAGPIAVEFVFQDSSGLYPSILYSFAVTEGGFVPLYPAVVYNGSL